MCVLSDGSRFEPVIGKPGDGASPSCAIVDEYHEHDSDVLYETMLTGMDAREQPLMFAITTAGVNLAGPCYSKRDYLCKVLDGTYHDDRQWGTIYTIDEDEDWTTVEALRKANPNYGVSILEDNIVAAHHSAIQNVRLQNTFKTKRLNLWSGAKNAWMNMQTWAQCPERKSLDDLTGRSVYVALDLASKVDIAAKVLLFPPTADDPLWYLHGRYYLPEDKVEEGGANASHYAAWAKLGVIVLTPGGVTDYEYIIEDLKEDRSRFQIEEVPYDPFQATFLATTLQSDGFPMVEMGATVKNFSEPMKEFESLVVDKKLAHGDCPVMNWMISNVVAKMDRKDNIYPNKEFTENKIDGPVAAIMALGRAKVYLDTSQDFDDFISRPIGLG
jgi:phage terminase large subunit-like protein